MIRVVIASCAVSLCRKPASTFTYGCNNKHNAYRDNRAYADVVAGSPACAGSSICNNKMGGKTAAAVLAVLAVRENPDGTPAFNNSLTAMELDGESVSPGCGWRCGWRLCPGRRSAG